MGRQNEINRCKELGYKYVNFTCLQTLDEAEIDLNKLRRRFICLKKKAQFISTDSQKIQAMIKN